MSFFHLLVLYYSYVSRHERWSGFIHPNIHFLYEGWYSLWVLLTTIQHFSSYIPTFFKIFKLSFIVLDNFKIGGISKRYFWNRKFGKKKPFQNIIFETHFLTYDGWNSKSRIHKMCSRKYVMETFWKRVIWKSFLKGVKQSFQKKMACGSKIVGDARRNTISLFALKSKAIWWAFFVKSFIFFMHLYSFFWHPIFSKISKLLILNFTIQNANFVFWIVEFGIQNLHYELYLSSTIQNINSSMFFKFYNSDYNVFRILESIIHCILNFRIWNILYF